MSEPVAGSPIPGLLSDDKRLDRLLDYTKFHVGIYLSIGGGLVALIGAASKVDEKAFLSQFVGSRVALVIALFFMVLAGLAGGVIASCCTQCKSFEELWVQPQGPHRLKLFTGERWALIEHSAFWISLVFFAYSILSATSVWSWIWSH